MNRLIILTAVTNLLAPLWGQEVVRFDTVHQNVVGSFAVGVSVFERDSGYLIFSVQKGLADMSQDIFVGEFNGGGGLVSERTFQSFQQDWMGSSSPLARIGQSFKTGMSRGNVIGQTDSLFLYQFTLDGDTAWTRFIAVDTAYAMRGTAVTASEDVLLTGIHYPGWSDGGNEAFVYHLDSVGTIKSYHGYADFDGEDVVEGLDGSWYVCGSGNATSNNFDCVLVMSDTVGEEIWRRTVELFQPISLVALRDSGVLVLGGSATDVFLPYYSSVVKYDQEGIMVWQRDTLQTDQYGRPAQFHAGYEALDSTIVVCGWLSRSDVLGKGTVAKLAPNGVVLWTRLYSHFAGASIGSDQLFWDVKPTSDGGLVLTGETNSDDYPYAQLWLLKLDSAGCLVPGCGSVGVEEYLDALQPLLRVSPNPASDIVNIALDLPEGAAVQGEVRVVLLDATGRVAGEQKVQQSFNALRGTVDVSALPAGTYYLHLRDAKRWLAGSKVVVQ